MLGSVKVDRFSSLDTDVSVSLSSYFYFLEIEHCWKMVVKGIQSDTQVRVLFPRNLMHRDVLKFTY